MSILLSGYYPEGIVFVADKNATIIPVPSGRRRVEPTATKVLVWPSHKAIVGFVGLGRLEGFLMDKWMRDFIEETKGFEDIDEIAHMLRDRMQNGFDKDYSESTDITRKWLVVHFGGFADRNGMPTPVMYHIWNHGNIDPQSGSYPPASRQFRISEDIEKHFKEQTRASDYPEGVRDWLEDMIKNAKYKWFNNGCKLAAFNTFKGVIWDALRALQDAGFAPSSSGIDQRIAFCRMAVEVFGAFFTHYYPPGARAVGGGVDAVWLLWPE